MSKSYFLAFGGGNPASYSGLSPTLIQFVGPTGVTLPAPAISELFAGSGVYTFTYGPTTPIAFVCDAFTAIPGRYIFGAIDPADRADEYGNTLVAIGITLTAIGNSGGVILGLGSTASSFGTQSTDPVDAFGYLKRILENLEGDQNFAKATGVQNILSRGSSTLLRSKTLQNSVSQVTKTGL